MPGHGWPAPVVMMFAASGADPALPVGGANFREPQDAASESMSQRDRRGHGVVVLPHAADLALAEAVDADVGVGVRLAGGCDRALAGILGDEDGGVAGGEHAGKPQ